jgi:hypothetical protein
LPETAKSTAGHGSARWCCKAIIFIERARRRKEAFEADPPNHTHNETL